MIFRLLHRQESVSSLVLVEERVGMCQSLKGTRSSAYRMACMYNALSTICLIIMTVDRRALVICLFVFVCVWVGI